MESLLTGNALLMILAGVQDPGNVGTILRAAEAFGATGAVACIADGIGTANPFGPKALRASAGSALRIPIVHSILSTGLIAELRMLRVNVYAAISAEVPAKQDFTKESLDAPSLLLAPWDIDWKIPSAILIGNEGAGLPAELVRAADARVFIPQAASIAPVGIESLNAAIAASVLLYEAMRQRNAARQKHS
jgi:TrmH family RNA methyltransferase